jgi:dihydrofolate synthase / folylpolyglutamate synthase
MVHQNFSALDQLNAIRPLKRPKCSLTEMHSLDRALQFPSQSFPSVHIAGSQGKGSVSAMIAKGLEATGMRVGLYTSPHLFSFYERIQINGVPIRQEELEELFFHIRKVANELNIECTFFEFVTSIAFCFFQQQAVDIAIIETGLGGRWDATNLLSPLLTVITSISLEHCHILGNDLDTIAREKAGIFKHNIPAVIGPKALFPSVVARAKELGISLHVAKTQATFFVEENQAIAHTSLKHLPFTLTPESIMAGLSCRLPCRFECFGNVLLDVAHNREMLKRLLQAIQSIQFPGRKLRFIYGCLQDKDHRACLEELSPAAKHIHLVQARSPRAIQASDLASTLDTLGSQHYTIHETIADAINQGLAQARNENSILVITGSTYIMADARKALQVYLNQ